MFGIMGLAAQRNLFASPFTMVVRFLRQAIFANAARYLSGAPLFLSDSPLAMA